jgi:hypothetical protein
MEGNNGVYGFLFSLVALMRYAVPERRGQSTIRIPCPQGGGVRGGPQCCSGDPHAYFPVSVTGWLPRHPVLSPRLNLAERYPESLTKLCHSIQTEINGYQLSHDAQTLQESKIDFILVIFCCVGVTRSVRLKYAVGASHPRFRFHHQMDTRKSPHNLPK